jgi:mono/diheme cytochrome c family protein
MFCRVICLCSTVLLLMSCSGDNADTAAKQEQANVSAIDEMVQPELQLAEADGELIFNINCLPCHAAGPGHPGTMRLALRLGEEKSVLTERDDLHSEYVKTIVRQGILLMPPFRPSEITDIELNALATYLAGESN